MKRSEFTKKHNLSQNVPTTLEATRISVSNFAKSISDFLNGSFCGAVDVDVSRALEENSFIMIYSEHIAYFFKLLLTFLHGTEILYIKMYCNENNMLVIKINSPGFKDMTREELYDIIRTARAAHLSPCESADGFLLTAQLRGIEAVPLYARKSDTLLFELHKIFFGKGDVK